MKTCFLYPGQGAQYSGMGKDLYDAYPSVRRLFEIASDLHQRDFRHLLFEADEDTLKATDVAQTAITLVNLAASLLLEEQGISAQLCAGFSLGEYSAFWRAGILDEESLFALVKLRGEVMEAASRALDQPEASPGMTAVLGLSIDAVEECLRGIDDVFVGNHNSPTQIVLAGSDKGLKAARIALEIAGAMQVIRLKVSGPFHCPLMADARSNFAEKIKVFSFADPHMTVYSSVTGKILKSGKEAQAACLEQIVTRVRWVDVEECIRAEEPTRVIEVGPGRVLRGLWRSFYKKTPCQNMGKVADMEKILAHKDTKNTDLSPSESLAPRRQGKKETQDKSL